MTRGQGFLRGERAPSSPVVVLFRPLPGRTCTVSRNESSVVAGEVAAVSLSLVISQLSSFGSQRQLCKREGTPVYHAGPESIHVDATRN